MIDNIINSLFCLFTVKYRKNGFTLAEALIITVMTGACLLPILGTMQNAQVRTETFDHESKMQQYARSRLNAEIANAAFDHKSINIDDEYHYIVFFDESGDQDEAKKLELVKTSINLEDFKNLNQKVVKDHWSEEACSLFGITKSGNGKTPYLKVIHAYKTSVETKDNPELAFVNTDSNSEEQVETPKALLGIVVKTSLLESDDNTYNDKGYLQIVSPDDATKYVSDETTQVVPVTLFAFANLPVVSDEMIWLVDALNCKIYGIDSVSRVLGKTIDLPKNSSGRSGVVDDNYRPWHLAVHPSFKIMACSTKKHLYVINIDKKSGNFGDYSKSFVFPSEVKENGGIAFRPDGRYLFVCPEIVSGNYKLTTYKVNYHIESDRLVWKPKDTVASEPNFLEKNRSGSIQDSQDIVAVLAANDGYLYVARRNPAYGVIRYPMYCSILDDDTTWGGEKIVSSKNGLDANILSIDISPDGRMLAVVVDETETLFIYDTHNLKQILKQKVTAVDGVSGFSPNKVSFNAISNHEQSNIFNNKSLNLTITNKLQGQNNVAYVFYVEKTNSGNVLKKLRNIKNSDNKGANFALNSPDNSIVVISDQQKPQLYFERASTSDSEEDLSQTPENTFKFSNSLENNLNCFSIAANKRDILAIGSNDNLKLYDLNSLKIIEDLEFTTNANIKGLTFNPTGDMLLSYYGSERYGYSRFHMGDSDFKESDSGVAKSIKYAFDDRVPNMVFSLESDSGSSNAFWNVNGAVSEDWEPSDTAYDRHDFDLDTNWNRYDMIGMPDGGAMVLYGKTDGSSMVEWIGRRNWEQDAKKGKYRLFARWTNINSSSSENNIPDYDLNTVDSFLIDQATGIVAIESNHQLTSGYIVKTVSLKTGNASNQAGTDVIWNDESEEYSRYVTPIIFKKNASGKFELYDYAEPLDLEPNETYSELELRWINHGGYIPEDNYYIGFWNGDALSNSKSSGAIAYTNVTNYYLANYLYGGDQSIDFENIVNGNELDLPDSRYIGNSSRKYAISFKLEEKRFNNDFPPLYSKKLAISPDCGTLAFLSRYGNNGNNGDDKFPVLRLFDFRNCVFGTETQIEGMLLDYRVPFHSGAWNGSHVITPAHHWPNEDNENFFRAVLNTSYFKNDQLNKFSLATTKNDSWTSFNLYPANYRFSDTDNDINDKGRANKRFWGYLRPEANYSFMQMYLTDEPRVFINNSFIYGETEKGSEHFLSNSLPVNIVPYSSNLFQIDHASNQGGMNLSVFFNQNNKNKIFSSNISNETLSGVSGINGQYHSYTSSNENDRGWNSLTSAETYILNNYPSFIKLYKVGYLNQNNNTFYGIDMSYANMAFSRDRAKPVLYIKGKDKLFVVYKDKLVMTDPGDGTNSQSIVISSDGQKVIFGKGNNIKVYNISNFDEDSFKTQNPSITNNSDNYLGLIADIDHKAYPEYLAVKPFISYSSSKAGGDYNLLFSIGTFTVSTNASAVASGGIYLAKSGSSDIGFFKPFDNFFEVKTDALQRNSNSAAVAAYDNKLYLFGNSGGSGDPISGRVQSYDVNTEDSLTSMDDATYSNSEYNDSYQVSMGVSSALNSGSNYPKNFGVNSSDSDKYDGINGYISANSVGHLVHAFVSCTADWANDITCSSYINLLFDLPLTVNQVLVSNTNGSGVTSFTLLGSDNNFTNSETMWNNDSVSIDNNQIINIDKGTHKHFRLKLNSGSTLGLFQLRRKDVKRLTPPLQCSSSVLSGSNSQSFSWTRPDGETTYMQWASNKNNNSLKDAFINNNTDGNNWFSSYPSFWECDAAKPWILVSLSKAEAVCALRYANAAYNSSYTKAKTVKLYGSNDVLPSNISGILPGYLHIVPPHLRPKFRWEQIRFTNNKNDYSAPLVKYTGRDNRYAEETFVTAEVKQPKKFKHYLFLVESKIKPTQSMKLIGFELFSTYLDGEVGVTQDYMTPMTKDNLGLVKLGNGAACSTPYGLVAAGGKDSAASSESLLYWPHGINKYDGKYYEYGISRSLPGLNCARYNHALVWHKGKIYAIGGLRDSSHFAKNEGSGTSEKAFAEYLDYNSGNILWQNVSLSSFIFQDSETVNYNLARECLGACSFGDEIFIFGGNTNEEETSVAAYAWNPETKIVRRLTNLPLVLNPCCAVPYGSKIYVMGMNSGKLKIYEYTP